MNIRNYPTLLLDTD